MGKLRKKDGGSVQGNGSLGVREMAIPAAGF
jgi:hypothetical protein